MDSYRITNPSIFCPSNRSNWERGDLTVKNGKIVSNYEVVQCDILGEKFWILPGLIDCHVHICCDPNFVGDQNIQDKQIAFENFKSNSLECLKAGVTSIRDMGYYKALPLEFRDKKLHPDIVTPNIFSCGSLITGIKGHGCEIGKETSETELINTINEISKNKVDHIKIINDPIYFSHKELKKATDFIHSIGLYVACHAYSLKATEIAIDSDADSIEHTPGWMGNVNEQLVKKKSAIVPTCIASYDVINNPSLALSASYEQPLSTYENWWNDLKKQLPNSIQSGIIIGVGSDSGFPPTNFGESVWKEMSLLNQFGMPWVDCLRAATEINSKIIGRSDIGNLKQGSFADFIVFDSDPLKNKSQAFKSIKSVFKDGNCCWGIDILKQ